MHDFIGPFNVFPIHIQKFSGMRIEQKWYGFYRPLQRYNQQVIGIAIFILNADYNYREKSI